MAKSKKFGAFGGVFTPSILTILGVIMYLRLPWIAGQAGLYMTIGIILLAHLISVTTGLSVSSIATDKKVKAGGTYYMISRSLGLPIGGTLGLALFVGLSFSVSLYLIGFAESFLSYWGFPLDKDTIRLTGSIILVVVTVITFISTSLAIKTQYIIMTAIGLSLLSIVLGKHDFVPSEPLLSPITTAAPFIVLFGIFFPAVTGFEAGVSMSGDLRDPKKSIPVGTISAIAIGLVVYIALAFFFSNSVSSDLLVNDPNALLKISWIPEIVIAGIWGATLSSALGSILGAPRILQATAVDKITPRIFGKGVGETNEPRNAIILTFIIAEIGILIGELDVIARIVSMFFITTYGFLNLSCAIEKWASSDFHPEFKVPGIVSLIGSGACFIVMIQLDFIAMIGATILLGAIFLYLKRKELTLESGDTWEGIWASLVRTGLTKLKGGTTSIRNWRPNIILFSGGLQTRPHLAEIGKAIAGKLGMISNFDLVEDENAKLLFGHGVEALENTDEAKEGIFTKQLSCKNIYEGINVITRIYGFTGIEPNTILMGWARNTRHPDKFANLIKTLYELDYNSIFLDHDKEKSFGERKKIDLWWRGAGSNLSFALTVLRFIRSNELWKEAALSILIINDDGSLTDKIYKNINQTLDQYRMDAEVKIINNGIENRDVKDIIVTESSDTDLTILGISDENLSDPAAYIEKMNVLMNELGTIMLLHSSSFFEEINVGIERKIKDVKPAEISHRTYLPEIPVSKNTIINGEWIELDKSMNEITTGFIGQAYSHIVDEHKDLLISISSVAENQLSSLQKACSDTDSYRFTRMLNKSYNDILFQIKRILTDHFSESDKETNIMGDALDSYKDKKTRLINRRPESLLVQFDREELRTNEKEGLRLKLFKLRKKIVAALTKKPVPIEIKFRKLLQYYLGQKSEVRISGSLNQFGISTCAFFSDFRSVISKVDETYEKLSILNSKKQISKEQISSERESLKVKFDEIKNNSSNLVQRLTDNLLKNWREDLSDMNEIVEKPGVNFSIRKKLKLSKPEIEAIRYRDSYPYLWKKNYDLFANSAELEGTILLLKGRMKSVADNVSEKVSGELVNIKKLTEDVVEQIEQLNINNKTEVKNVLGFDYKEKLEHLLDDDFEDVRNLALELPERVEVTGEEFNNRIEEGKFKESDISTIQPRRLAEHLIESQFIEPIEIKMNLVSEKINQFAEIIRETVNLINFNLENLDEDFQDDKSIESQLNKLVKDSVKKINSESDKIDNISKSTGSDLIIYLNNSLNPLNSHSIVKSSGELGHLIRETGSKKVISGVSQTKDIVFKHIQKLIVNLVFRKSEGLILAKKLSSQEESGATNINSILDLIDSASPDRSKFNQLPLPYYYKKLFSGTSHVSSDFWVGMKNELSKASTAVKRYNAGFSGGLLIIGERNCGKSTLSRIIASKYFNKDRIHILKAGKEATSDITLFEEAARKSLGLNGSLEEIFQSMPQNSVVIINDLELWWERNSEGFKVIEIILNLISKYSNRILFVVNCSVQSFRLINTIKRIDDLFISIIQCEPFDAEDLKNVILLRHSSSGMKFKLGDTEEDSLSELRTASLFNSYFNYSKGNVGVALNTWLSRIVKVDGNIITIKPPVEPDTSMLQNLDSEWFVYLAQIILHRRLSIESLTKLMKTDLEHSSKVIASLVRSGLIIEKIENIYGINSFIEPYVTKILEKKELL